MLEKPKFTIVISEDFELFYQNQPPKNQAKILRIIKIFENLGPSYGSPHLEHIRGKIWCLRIPFERKNYRIFYSAISKNSFLLLNGYDKRQEKTSEHEIQLAQTILAKHTETRFRQVENDTLKPVHREDEVTAAHWMSR